MSNLLEETQKRLDEVSPSFCLAKYTQISLHLQNGHNHSCHHNPTHQCDSELIRTNPSALHNTVIKKDHRQQMLVGDRPKECEYCWSVERNGGISDRIIKSAADWSRDRFDEAFTIGSQGDFEPSYIEVSFSNICNFKCSYCSPPISSKWMEEVRQYGGYPTSRRFNSLDHFQQEGKMPIPEREENPYTEAFWKWFPEVYPSLMDFRITGGEPLLSKHTFRVLEYILENPNSKLRLSVNTNLCVPISVFHRFFDLLRKIILSKSCKGFILYTSADTHGDQAAYIRNGMDYQHWLMNLDDYLKIFSQYTLDYSKVVIMSTFNALSLSRYDRFFDDIMVLREKYPGHLVVDIPHLTHPQHQSIWVLPDSARDQFMFLQEYIENHPRALDVEKIKIKRIVEEFNNRPWTQEELQRNRRDFGLFFQEHDRRRGTDFSKTFPELQQFYEECLQLREEDNEQANSIDDSDSGP